MIRNIFFDLDDTLLDFQQAERVALSKTLTHAGVKPEPAALARYSQINSRQWELLEEGKLNREQVKLRRFQLFFREMGITADPGAAAKEYEELLGIGHYWMPGAQQLLEELKGKYRLYLATNGTASVQHGRIASAGMADYFEEIFISQELGADKPSLDYFHRCFAKIPDFFREETVMVGDRLTSDILGGARAGIKTVWFNPANQPLKGEVEPDAVITQLAQLPPLLERL